MKKIFLFFAFINIINYASSQSIEEISKKANDLFESGNYSESIAYLEKFKKLISIKFGTYDPDYASALYNQAICYEHLANYSEAETCFRQALNIRSKILGTSHQYYATSLDGLGLLFLTVGRYNEAEPLLRQSLSIREKAPGNDNVEYAISLNNLALFYRLTGKYLEAEPAYINSLGIIKKNLGSEHSYYITTLFNLARLYFKLENYHKADSIFQESLNIIKKVYNPSHPFFAERLSDIADFYDNIGNYSQAELLFIEAGQSFENQIETNLSSMGEDEMRQLLENKIGFYFDIFNSFFYRRASYMPSLVANSYDNELNHKGLLLNKSITLKQEVYNIGDYGLVAQFEEYLKSQNALTNLLVNPPSLALFDSLQNTVNDLRAKLADKPNDLTETFNRFNLVNNELINQKTIRKDFVAQADSLNAQIKFLEKTVLHNLDSISSKLGKSNLTKTKWTDIQKNLSPTEAAIEFVSFQYHSRSWTDSIFYCALVLRKDYTYPKMVYLFEEKELKRLISTPKAVNNVMYIDNLYGFNPNLPHSKDTLGNKNELYRLIWKPIEKLLNEVQTVYLAPSGLLNKVSFNAIPINDSTFLIDKYKINLVSSTRVINVNKQPSSSLTPNSRVALFGGIEYDLDSLALVTMADQYLKSAVYRFNNRTITSSVGYRGSTWQYLDGTINEVQNIKKILQSRQIPSLLYSGKDASKSAFIYLISKGKSPDVLHFATHGFFFPREDSTISKKGSIQIRNVDLNDPVFKISENPLLRCGLIFAGANMAWKNLSPIQSFDDGTLTALEVADLELSNTKLAVLSACVTGLGDVNGSEGVYGLNRAFKQAGVKYIIMSLWQVPDYQTSELMKLFYSKWINGIEIKDAFRLAQIELRKKYDPYNWAAFTLIE